MCAAGKKVGVFPVPIPTVHISLPLPHSLSPFGSETSDLFGRVGGQMPPPRTPAPRTYAPRDKRPLGQTPPRTDAPQDKCPPPG